LLLLLYTLFKERLQVQQQIQTSSTNNSSYYYKNGYDALIQISKTEGIRGIYKGYGATLASFGPFSALYFTIYEQMKVYSRRYIYDNNKNTNNNQQQQEQQQILQQQSTTDSTGRIIPTDYELEKLIDIPFLYTLFCSTSAGAIASWCTSPLDMVKLRLQVHRAQQASTTRAVMSTTTSSSSMNMISLLYNTIVTEGIPGLFRGAGARVLHFTPATAITITLYETCRSWVYQILETK
jgi:Mitochondrial carrier protein